jgi:hypothetical protein
MAAIKSLDRNLESEDAAADRDARMNDAEVYGADAVNAAKPPEGEEMRIMAARDVHVHEPTPPAPPPAPVQQPKPKRSSLLKSVAIATALSGMGGGIGVAVPWLLGMFDKTPPIAAPSDEWTERRLENYVPTGGVP